MTQNADVLNHLRKNKSLSPLEALRLYGCLRLGARLWELRCKGHLINMTLAKGRKHYAVYTLLKDARR